jgi:hypothetical protein
MNYKMISSWKSKMSTNNKHLKRLFSFFLFFFFAKRNRSGTETAVTFHTAGTQIETKIENDSVSKEQLS